MKMVEADGAVNVDKDSISGDCGGDDNDHGGGVVMAMVVVMIVVEVMVEVTIVLVGACGVASDGGDGDGNGDGGDPLMTGMIRLNQTKRSICLSVTQGKKLVDLNHARKRPSKSQFGYKSSMMFKVRMETARSIKASNQEGRVLDEVRTLGPQAQIQVC